MGKEGQFMVMHGNWTSGGKHTIMHTDIKLLCHIPESHMVLLANVTSIKKKKQQQLIKLGFEPVRF